MERAGIIALAGVGRERENPRSERSEPAALKVQLGEVDWILGGELSKAAVLPKGAEGLPRFHCVVVVANG